MKSLCYGDPAAGNSEALGNQEEHYGVSLACGDNMQTDGVGSCGALVPGLRPFDAGVRPPVACALDVRRADPGGQPSGALSRPRVPESGADLQPRSGTRDQHAALGYRLGRVVLARPSPLCPPLVGPSAAFGVAGHPPDRVVRRGHRTLYWLVPNDAGRPSTGPSSAGRGLPGYRVVGADDRRAATGKRA